MVLTGHWSSPASHTVSQLNRLILLESTRYPLGIAVRQESGYGVDGDGQAAGKENRSRTRDSRAESHASLKEATAEQVQA